VRILGYFSKPKGVREQRSLVNTVLFGSQLTTPLKSVFCLLECNRGTYDVLCLVNSLTPKPEFSHKSIEAHFKLKISY
jgi:hypothetical protein